MTHDLRSTGQSALAIDDQGERGGDSIRGKPQAVTARQGGERDSDVTSKTTLVLTPHPESVFAWLSGLFRYKEVLLVLTRKDFQTRYKRASFGVAWAIAVPALQASIMAVVFSHVVKTGTGRGFPVFVIGGVVAYSYFSMALSTASTSIVDGASLTDKVWFPRALLTVVPCLSNVVGLLVSLVVLVAVMPAFSVGYGSRLLLIFPASLLLILFTIGLSLVASALHVYFRDVRFLVQASLMVWLYVTPIVYTQHLLGRFGPIVDANPLTGTVDLFHAATVGNPGAIAVPLIISVGVTLVLFAMGAVAHSRYDRLFVDQL